MPTPSIKGYPRRYESRLTLKNGEEVFLRPILPTDGPLLLDLFNRMSPQSVRMRFLRRMNTLPEDMIRRFTHIDYSSEFALVAIIREDEKEAILAVGRYAHDPNENLTELAVAVRDDRQHLCLGKPLLAKVVDIAKEHGISRFMGMMDPRNHVIRRILSDLGYDVKYYWESGFFRLEIVA